MKRYHQLDTLRGLAAMAVFASHAIGMLTLSPLLEKLYNSILHLLFDGHSAVLLFFTLSGFVLYFSLKGQINLVGYLKYLCKRIFRIYPLFIFVTLLAVLLKTLLFRELSSEMMTVWFTKFWSDSIKLKDLFFQLTLIGPGVETHLINPVIWSLVVEMKISIIYPLIVFGMKKINRPLFDLVLLLVSIIILNLFSGSTVYYLQFFILGGYCAKYLQPINYYYGLLEKKYRVLLLIVAVLLYSVRDWGSSYILSNQLMEILTGLGAVGLMVVSLCSNKIENFFSKKSLSVLGVSSYSLYLLHFPVLLTVTSIFISLLKFSYGIYIIWAISLTFTLSISFILYLYFEKPFITIGKKLGENIQHFYEIRKDSVA